jgi:hypothetical protein
MENKEQLHKVICEFLCLDFKECTCGSSLKILSIFFEIGYHPGLREAIQFYSCEKVKNNIANALKTEITSEPEGTKD